jgi:hypothetical protein
MVTDCAEDVVPTAVAGKLSDAGLGCRRSVGEPVPVRLTVAEEGTALAPVAVSVADSTPATDGEKVTWRLHVVAGARLPPLNAHAGTSVGALSAKSLARAPAGPLIPLTAKLNPEMATCPVLVT